MAGAEASSCGVGGTRATLKLNCSHGGRFLPFAPDGAPRYVGGETRALAVPRAATFRDLAARLSSEVAGGAEVRAIRHRLADDDEGPLGDVLVSVTCDEELAHMRDEYDRLRATRPAARFRIFLITAASAGFQRWRAEAGLPPLAPKMRRIQSELAQLHLHLRPALRPAPMRRVQSAEEFGRGTHVQPAFPHSQRRGLCAPAPPPARPVYAVPCPCICMAKKVAAPLVSTAKATRRVLFTDVAREKVRSRDAQAAMENRRTIWESVRA